MKRMLMLALAVVLAGTATWTFAADSSRGQADARPQPLGGPDARGAALYSETCSSCHGAQGGGIPGRGPSLRDVGAASVDFYLRTGRMPIERPEIQPRRAEPFFSEEEIRALVVHVTGLGGRSGPEIPDVDPESGDIVEGRKLFADSCSGCHQIVGQGGIAPELIAPALSESSPRVIGEAIRIGPYLMPRFGEKHLDEHEVDSIARYITTIAQDPPDEGGWGIGNIGPIPEGMVAWLLAGAALLLVARVIGERSE